jgi:phage baseplate assembly protein V
MMKRELDALGRKLRLLIGRCILSAIDDSGTRQLVQIQRLADETGDDAERFTHYGFSSAPLPGCEAICLDVAGVRSHTVIIADGDSRYRLHLVNGEVALHDDLGQKVHLTRDGIRLESPLKVDVVAPEVTVDADTVIVTGDATVQGNALVEGNATVEGTTIAKGDVKLGGESPAKYIMLADMTPSTKVMAL